jgi:hypothetical protein
MLNSVTVTIDRLSTFTTVLSWSLRVYWSNLWRVAEVVPSVGLMLPIAIA